MTQAQYKDAVDNLINMIKFISRLSTIQYVDPTVRTRASNTIRNLEGQIKSICDSDSNIKNMALSTRLDDDIKNILITLINEDRKQGGVSENNLPINKFRTASQGTQVVSSESSSKDAPVKKSLEEELKNITNKGSKKPNNKLSAVADELNSSITLDSQYSLKMNSAVRTTYLNIGKYCLTLSAIMEMFKPDITKKAVLKRLKSDKYKASTLRLLFNKSKK